jgi:peptide/nickel transport system permease protein
MLPRARFRAAPTVAGAVIVLLVLIALAAPLIAPYDPNAVSLLHTNEGSSSAHLLGTDVAGRDILSRLIYGTRLSFLGPLVVVSISTTLGVTFGLLGGYVGGFTDGTIGRVWDLLLGFPPLLLALTAVAAIGRGFWTAAIAISVIYTPLVARIVRSGTLVEKEKTYVSACQVGGYGNVRIALRHILPSLATIIVAQSALNFGYALLDLAGLSFLGFGVQPPTAEWGAMLADGRNVIFTAPTEVIAASAAIAIAVVSFNLVGDALVGERSIGRFA